MKETREGRMGLGCWFFGEHHRPDQDDCESIATVKSALDLGIAHFDTSRSYGNGHSESILGLALHGKKQEHTVATKSSCVSKDEAIAAVQASRARLNRDTIDIFYIHWPRKGCSHERMMEGLETARSRNWVRRIGVSNFSVEQMRDVMRVGKLDVHQTCYNLLWRYPERELLPFCRESSIDVVTYSSIAQGLLTDKTGPNPSFAPYDKRSETVFYEKNVWPHVWAAVREMQRVAGEAGLRLSELAIRWVMAQESIDTVLVGAKNRAQLSKNVEALEKNVSSESLAELGSISGEAMRHIPDVGNIFRNYP